MKTFKRIKNWLLIVAEKETYSYKKLLEKTLLVHKPKKILEWGTGRSTILMHKLLPRTEIHSIEHNWKWCMRWRLGIFGVNLHCVPSLEKYISPNFPEKYFDFIFIDGTKRVECMKTSLRLLKDDGLLMLHDSNREEYKKCIKLYEKVEESNNTILMRKK